MFNPIGQLHQENKLSVMVNKDTKKTNSREELEETVQVAPLCMQFHPSQHPNMFDMVRMLEGKGLAERRKRTQRRLRH